MTDAPEPLDPALRALLDQAEGEPGPVPGGAMDRVLDRGRVGPRGPRRVAHAPR